MNTNDTYTNAATTGNVAYIYVTVEDTIPATQNVAYGQVPPGTDDCYIGVGASLRAAYHSQFTSKVLPTPLCYDYVV